MLTDRKITSLARKTMNIEAQAILGVSEQIGRDFISAVHLIRESAGRVIVSGIGKSAIIANKIVATFNSTGTPAVFLHAADAIHGDLGMVQKDDVVLLISNSGNTPEIKVLAPLVKAGGNPLIAMVGNISSELARHADLVLPATITQEACPHNLAPTSSTTAQLALGDALAVCLLESRGFTAEDFARYHPGGALGKRLYLKVDDLWRNNARPEVAMDAPVNDVIIAISGSRLGCTAVVEKNKLAGIVTDGDLRRMMSNHPRFDTLKARDIMSRNPKTVAPQTMAVEALAEMKKNNITQLVVAESGRFIGFVHLHDLLKEGIL